VAPCAYGRDSYAARGDDLSSCSVAWAQTRKSTMAMSASCADDHPDLASHSLAPPFRALVMRVEGLASNLCHMPPPTSIRAQAWTDRFRSLDNHRQHRNAPQGTIPA